ncbi:ABC transporter substrate-binding protein [Pseudoflavitalea sp. G-6-1-2]|uniref:ABC transporter substrate-binding protein n=1 Tax=Pseudoflavitalea sp. G-6-1-2 TaxID=2728841 RepID=UPI00146F2FCD|nr:ABC transporter substrate-binding protein [Pseudoflavitalea sp. G-6-1-2]NML22095.1 ABC transporter substrate-binding protein [Pseudoflavitalea sp. G-6-1-2]
MNKTIGILLPRSGEYPAMGFDILAGLKAGLAAAGLNAYNLETANIGFGEDPAVNYACAEKILLQHDVQAIICYSNFFNAEPLYALATATGKPFIFLDAGMQLMTAPKNDYCFHISLQGVHACSIAGARAATGNRRVLMATSFYDGGYRGPWGYHVSIEEAGGSICGNYVSTYKKADFTIQPYMELLQQTSPEGIAACFSSYLAELFFDALKQAGEKATSIPFYCSPFMAEEALLGKCTFPGGTFHAFVPWYSSIENEQQQAFAAAIKNGADKNPNLFSLLGWEAATVLQQLNQEGRASLSGFSYQSPRGAVTIHADTNHTYAPVYYGMIVPDQHGKCSWQYHETIPIDSTMHLRYLIAGEDHMITGWKNNYFCI